jgi:putative spermidine/putrescine transport system permease protein
MISQAGTLLRSGSSRPYLGGSPSLLALPVGVILALLLLWPGLILLRESVGLSDGASSLSFSKYADLLLVPHYRGALLGSIGLGLFIAAVSTLLCLAPAWLLVRYHFPGKRLVRAVFALPLSFSGILVGFLMVHTLGRAGVLPTLAERLTGRAWLSGVAYQFGGILLAYLYFEIPRACLTLEATLKKFDFRLDAAAQSLGASSWQRFRWVALPLLRPALLSTFAVTWSVSLGSFGVVLILATRDFTLLPLEMFMQYLAFPPDRAQAAAMAVTLMVVALGANVGSRILVARWEKSRGPAILST